MQVDIGALFKAAPATDTADKKYTPIPTGRYDVTVHHAQIDMTKETPRVLINYKIAEEGEFKGRILFSSFMLNEKGAAILKESLTKLGVNVNEVNTLDDLNTALSTILHLDCTVFAKQREYTKTDGTTAISHNVYVNASSASLDKSLTADDALLKASDASSDDFSFD